MSNEMQAQCWICPICHDDHGRLNDCDIRDLYKVITTQKRVREEMEIALRIVRDDIPLVSQRRIIDEAFAKIEAIERGE